MKRYFDKTWHRLVFIEQVADSIYWDNHWKTDDRGFAKQLKNTNNRFVLGKTKKHLFAGAKILEGGCGQGATVYTLHRHGYDVYGVDYAKDTVKNINQYAPELKVKFADVRQLPFPERFFDGYWSLGVIEHFYGGYEDIAREMLRVLKPDGYLFITVPVMSPLRKFKAKLGLYPEWHNQDKSASNFFQFAFNPKDIVFNLKLKGFKLIKTEPYDGIKGLKDEVVILKHCLQYIYDSQSFPLKLLKKTLDIILKHFTNHMCLFVMQKVS